MVYVDTGRFSQRLPRVRVEPRPDRDRAVGVDLAPWPSRISAASLTSHELSGSFQPQLATSEAQCGNALREYLAMLPEGVTLSLASKESASSAEGGDGAPAAVDGGVAGLEPHPTAADAITTIMARIPITPCALTRPPVPARRSSHPPEHLCTRLT
jgi:hypothetical protein